MQNSQKTKDTDAISTLDKLIESAANDIIAAIREHGPTRDVIIPRLEKLIKRCIAQHADPEDDYADRAEWKARL